MIQYQILQIDIIRIAWQTVRRITNEIMGIKGLSSHALISTFSQISAHFNVKHMNPLNNHPPISLTFLIVGWDKWKTCFHCHFISNFLSFNYGRISTGEQSAPSLIKNPPAHEGPHPFQSKFQISPKALIPGNGVHS